MAAVCRECIRISRYYGTTLHHSFMYAVIHGHLNCMKLYITRGADVNDMDKKGCTVLMKACTFGYDKCVDMIIRAGADVNAVGQNGGTALTQASQSGNKKCVSLLLEEGVDPDTADKCGKTPLLYAVEYGRLNCADLLIKSGANVNVYDKDGWSALLKAITNGHSSCVELLIGAGADVNAKSNGSTPLICASSKGDVKCIAMLIKAGADVNATDNPNNNYTALDLLASLHIPPVIGGCTALIKASNIGSVQCVNALITAGADVNIANDNGFTALILSALNPDSHCFEKLIQTNVNVNHVVTHDGSTALTIVAQRGWSRMVQLLIAKGADVNIVDKSGSSALTYALRKQHDKCIYYLLSAGSTTWKIHHDDLSECFIRSARMGDKEYLQQLLKTGVNVNAVDCHGFTAFRYAVVREYNELIELLRCHGADVNVPDNEGYTMLAWAVERNNKPCVKMCLEMGADVNAVNNDGDTALMITNVGTIAESLLTAGAHINTNTPSISNALKIKYKEKGVKELLHAAGDLNFDQALPKTTSSQLCFKHICREAIRRRLIQINPRSHLFGRIPLLGLPPSLTSYLLYHVTLGSDN